MSNLLDFIGFHFDMFKAKDFSAKIKNNYHDQLRNNNTDFKENIKPVNIYM